jgi:peroxin-16
MEKSVFVDLTLISSSGMEFIIEIIMKFFYPSKYQQKYIIEILSIFELFKFFLRCKKIEMNPFRKIFISERSYFSENLATATQCSNEFDDLYKFEYTGLVEKTEDTFTLTKKECQHKILSYFNSLEEKCCDFNQEYEELYPRTKKIVKQITTMPIPEEMFMKNKNSETENLKIWLGEVIYVFRPIIYCYSLLLFKYSSFKPYFISMALDVLRMILQKNINFHWMTERNEFAKRNYDLLFNYVFRNPIYSKIIKGKFLNPFFRKIFRNFISFKKLVFWLLELRLSLCFLM